MIHTRRAWLRLALAALLATGSLQGQELEPRSYVNIPVGLNFLLVGGAYQEGDVLTDPSLDVADVTSRVKFAAIGYLRSFGIAGRSAKFSVATALADYAATGLVEGEPREREQSGFTDPLFKLSVNLLGSPALSPAEFRAYAQDLVLGVSLGVSAPLGAYDSGTVINLGFNRWAFKPEVGISKVLGRWIVEGSAAVSFYTDNTDFNGGLTRQQDNLYSVQAHVIYRLRPGKGMWCALDLTHFRGGATTTDGVENDNELRNNRYGLTLALPINRQNSIKLYASSGVSSRRGNEYDLIGLAWQYLWGAGL